MNLDKSKTSTGLISEIFTEKRACELLAIDIESLMKISRAQKSTEAKIRESHGCTQKEEEIRLQNLVREEK